MTKTKFENRGNDVFTGSALVLRSTGAGMCIFRLDGRSGDWRVDRLGICGWEAIDNGDPLPDKDEAARYVDLWVTAASRQDTYHPSRCFCASCGAYAPFERNINLSPEERSCGECYIPEAD